jgi:cell division protein FtsW (lipid II flippase)
MNAATCAVLAGVFPLILITVVLEIRSVHFKLRSRRWFQQIAAIGMTFCLTGLVLAVVGVAIDGFTGPASLWPWALFGGAMIALTITVMGILATGEIDDERKLAKRKK